MSAPGEAPKGGEGFFGLFATPEKSEGPLAEKSRGAKADLAPMPSETLMFGEESALRSSENFVDTRNSISQPPAAPEPSTNNGGKPVKKNLRKESISMMVKKSYDADDAKASGPALEKRLKELNQEEAEAPTASDATAVGASSLVIDHESGRYFAWSALMTILAFYSNFVVAYQIAFWAQFNSFQAVLVVEYLIDLTFIADLVSGFFVSYMEEDVRIVDRAQIRHKFLHSARFYLDALACLPLDVLQLGVGWNPLCRLNKLCRLYSLAHHTGFLLQQTRHPGVVHTATQRRLSNTLTNPMPRPRASPWLACHAYATQAPSRALRLRAARLRAATSHSQYTDLASLAHLSRSATACVCCASCSSGYKCPTCLHASAC